MEFVYDEDSAQDDAEHFPPRLNVPPDVTSGPASITAPSNAMITPSLHPTTSHDSERTDDVDIQAATLRRSRRLIFHSNTYFHHLTIASQ